MKKLLLSICISLCILPLVGKAQEEQASFSAIAVTGSAGTYEVKGNVNPKLEAFYYTVEDGHEEFVSETKISVANQDQFIIKVKIPPTKLPSNATLIMNLYAKTSNGEKVDMYPVVLDTFE